MQAAIEARRFVRARHVQLGLGPHGAINQGVQTPAMHPLTMTERVIIADRAEPSAWKDLYTFDVGTMKHGFVKDQVLDAEARPKGIKPAAGADLARLVGSLESKLPAGSIASDDVTKFKAAAFDAYRSAMNATHRTSIDKNALAAAARWYRIEMEVAAAQKPGSGAVERIERLLGIAPPSPSGLPRRGPTP